MPYVRYFCMFAHSGVQHILCCAFVLFFFVLCSVAYVASFSGLSPSLYSRNISKINVRNRSKE